MNKRRYTPEQKQEKESRNQLDGFLDQYEWIASDVYPDLGEDVLVRIYEEEVSTGISFYIQLKSTDDIKKYRMKSGVISYRFKVKDLLHWENQAIPILIVVWDTSQKTGWWVWATEAIEKLDEKNCAWRGQKTTQIHIDCENKLTEKALFEIRFFLANFFFKNVAKGRTIDIQTKFVFPNTDEGKKKASEFEKSVKKGDRLELDSEYISKVEFPDWFERLYGKDTFQDQQKMVVTPTRDEVHKPAKIIFKSEEFGKGSIPYVDFRIEKEGQEEMTLSNAQQSSPYLIRLVVNKTTNEQRFTIKTNYSSLDGSKAKEILRLRKILSTGGKVTINMLVTGKSMSSSIPAGLIEKPTDYEIEFINNIGFIQEAFGEPIVFPEDGSFAPNDVIEAKNLVEIVRSGVIEFSGNNFTVDLPKSGIEHIFQIINDKKPIRFRLEWGEYSKKVLTTEIQLGRMTQYITGNINEDELELERWIADASEEDSLKVSLNKVKVREEYHKWIKDD